MLQGSRMFQKGKRCLLPFCRHGEVGLPLVWHSFFGRKASPTSRSFVRPLPSVNTWASRLCPFPLSRCPPQATLIMPGGDGRGGRKTWCHFSLSQVSHNASLSLYLPFTIRCPSPCQWLIRLGLVYASVVFFVLNCATTVAVDRTNYCLLRVFLFKSVSQKTQPTGMCSYWAVQCFVFFFFSPPCV